jgi:K+-transporting ATPase ATPase A chain
MTPIGWVQVALLLGLLLATAVPLGRFIAQLADGRRTLLHPVLAPVERGFYRLAGIDPAQEMGWKAYAFALVLFNALCFLIHYALLRWQAFLPFNPRDLGAVSPQLSFNTAISFVSNTSWQAYNPEATMAHGSQMLGLTVHSFLSAATGIAVALAVARAFARSDAAGIGNFWVDLTRITLYLLLPLSVLVGLLLMAAGVPQTLLGGVEATTLEGAKQTILLGPVAFQEAIKLLSSDGGGFFNANSAHPFENPTALTSLLETWCMAAIPVALPITFGSMVGDKRQGRAILLTMAALAIVALLVCSVAETNGNPLLAANGVDAAQGNMEGKEVRFGVPLSVAFNIASTATGDGAVNATMDSFMPLSGMMPMFLIQLGEVLPGGVGSGLYGFIIYTLLGLFTAGLMVGRTPEYLGKKIQTREVRLAMLAFLILPLLMLGGTAISVVLAVGLASISNAGPHGLSQLLYAWTSATGNNGSAFAGITADTAFLDVGLGIAMLVGRYAIIVPVLAIAGAIAAKPKMAESAGTFPTHGPLFIGLMIGVILAIGGLEYVPALCLGPVAEHYKLLTGATF